MLHIRGRGITVDPDREPILLRTLGSSNACTDTKERTGDKAGVGSSSSEKFNGLAWRRPAAAFAQDRSSCAIECWNFNLLWRERDQ